MDKNEYKEIIKNDGYQNTELIIQFLSKATMYDILKIQEISQGMRDFEYFELKKAIDELVLEEKTKMEV